MKIYDVTVPVSTRLPVYPGDAGFRLEAVSRMSQGAAFDTSLLSIGSHTGTHVDPPAHFIPGGATADALPLDVLIGPALVHDVGAAPEVTVELLIRDVPAGTERLLLKTRNSAFWSEGSFRTDFTFVAPEAASWLVTQGVRLVGIDYLSLERYGSSTAEAHRLLLGAGVIIVEGLDLSPVTPGNYELVCLPLRLAGGDGAPARAVLLQRESR